MRLEPVLPADSSFDMRSFARKVVLRGILAATDGKGVMKERVMLARECGFLDDAETRAWIVRHGLEAA